MFWVKLTLQDELRKEKLNFTVALTPYENNEMIAQ